MKFRHRLGSVGWTLCLVLAGAVRSWAQIDPESRRLLQLGYDQPVEGKSPLAGYAFYYWNEPGVWRTNLTLRLVVAPVYLESELGARSLLGPNTDFGLGVQGGGYADSHAEIRQGHYYQEESFTGHGGDLSGSIYHRFNPEQRVPLHGMLRAGVHYTEYSAGRHTSPTFVMPADEPSLHVRGGLRWGGIEPVLHPALAMELSGSTTEEFTARNLLSDMQETAGWRRRRICFGRGRCWLILSHRTGLAGRWDSRWERA